MDVIPVSHHSEAHPVHRSGAFPATRPVAHPVARPVTQPRAGRTVRMPAAASWLGFIREVGIVALAALVYFAARGLIETRAGVAYEHANWIVSFERNIGIFHEAWFQSWIVGSNWRTDLANAIYIYGHWPVIAATLSWLLIRHRQAFQVYRSALLISGAIGIVFFVMFPLAPPRFLSGLGFVDTVSLHSEAYRVLQPPSLTNQYAAMPSLHVGWNLLMGIAIVTQARHLFWKAFGVAMPVAMYLATIVTANHYILDGIAGATVALIGLAIAWKLTGHPARRSIEQPAGTPAMSPLFTLRR